MIILGIDGGLAGGLAIIKGTVEQRPTVVAVSHVPTMGEGPKRRVDPAAVISFIEACPPDFAFVERAQAFPGQGASSGFNYGRAIGYLECCVLGLGIPLDTVEASAWKRAHQLSGKRPDGTKYSDAEVKENSRQRALMLFPAAAALFARKMDHGPAEAALIANYGRMLKIGGR